MRGLPCVYITSTLSLRGRSEPGGGIVTWHAMGNALLGGLPLQPSLDLGKPVQLSAAARLDARADDGIGGGAVGVVVILLAGLVLVERVVLAVNVVCVLCGRQRGAEHRHQQREARGAGHHAN